MATRSTLVERLGDVSRRFPVLWGLWYVPFTRGQYLEAHESAQQLLRAAQAENDTGRLLEAHHSLWATLSAMGRPADAAVHAERGIELYDRERHGSHAFLYGGHDPGACCRYHLAIDRWLLGYPDQALATVREAYGVAEQLGHAMTTFITLGFMACVLYQRGEREAAAETAERVRLLAESHGFKNWPEAGIVMTHVRATARLDAAALAEIGQRLFDVRGAAWIHIFFVCVFAELCGDAGHPEQGLRALAGVADSVPRHIVRPRSLPDRRRADAAKARAPRQTPPRSGSARRSSWPEAARRSRSSCGRR